MISIKVDTSDLRRLLDDGGRKATRSMAIALSKTAVHAQAMVKQQLPQVFDRPTSFTLAGTVVRRATYQSLTAEVVAKDYQAKYLSPEVYGGQRKLKRFELALQARLALPKGWFVVPADGAPLDSFGNVSRGFIAKVIAQLGTELLSGYQNTAKGAKALGRAKAKNGTFFAIQPGNRQKMPPGIYQRVGTGFGQATRAVFIFVQAARYKQRLPLDRIAQDAVRTHLRSEFDQAFRT